MMHTYTFQNILVHIPQLQIAYIAHTVALRILDSPAPCMRHRHSAHSTAALQVVCGTMGLPTATVRMRGPDGIARTSTGMGTGPVDAAMKAIDSQVRVQVIHLKPGCLRAALIMKHAIRLL